MDNDNTREAAMFKHKWASYNDPEGNAWRAGYYHGWNDAGAASVDREAIVDLLTDVMNTHKHPDSFCYNECDIEPCSWCERAAAILSQYKGEVKKEKGNG